MWPFNRPSPSVRQISSIGELSQAEKAEIESSTEAGMTPRDIASALNLPVVVVWNYRKSIRAQERTAPADPIKSAMADLQAQKIQLQIQQIQQDMDLRKAEHDAEMRELLADDDSGDELGWIKEILPMFAPRGSPAPPPNPPAAIAADPTPSGAPAAPAAGVTFTDEEIAGILRTVPPVALRLARKMDDGQLAAQIRSYYPRLDDDTVERAMRMVRS